MGVLGTSRQCDLWAAQRQKPRPMAWLSHPVWLNPREKPGEWGELAAWWHFPSSHIITGTTKGFCYHSMGRDTLSLPTFDLHPSPVANVL